MPTQKIDPKVIFASNAPAIDKPPVFDDKTKGWDEARANDGRPTIKKMNKLQQDTDLKILWLNENSVTPYDESIDYPEGAVTIKDDLFKQLVSGDWVNFLGDFADKDEVKRGIANRYDPLLTYNIGERVVLINGDVVKSIVDGNVSDPNVNMTGWVSTGLISLNDISELPENSTNTTAYVKSVDSFYIYDGLTSAININGWKLLYKNIIKTSSLGLSDGANLSSLIQFALDNNLFIDLEKGKTFVTSLFDLDAQAVIMGEGFVQYIYDYLSNDNTEHIAPKIANPYPPKGNGNKYGWYDSVEARGNFEHGSGYGLIVNDDVRPQVCGFRTKQQQKDYASVDMVGLYTHIASPKSVTLTNCTFTANSVTSASLTEDMDIRVGDFIRTSVDPAINKPWRSEITSIDYVTKTLGVTWWLHESGNGEGVPPNGLSCEAPYTNGLWGHNTNVFLYNGRPAHSIIGYELGVYSEKTRDNFTSIDGYYAVNLTSQIAQAQHAFKTGGTWDKGLGAYNCIDAIYTDGTTRTGLNFSPSSDTKSAAVRYDLNTRRTGYVVRSVAGTDDIFSMDAQGVLSHNRQDYSISSTSRTINALAPTLVLGALAQSPHTTTINTVNMPAKTIFTFRQLDAVNWTIVAGASTYVLNTAGAIDYLQLLYDGSSFLKLFAGKSL